MPTTFINWLISETHPFAPAAYKALGPGETSSQSQAKQRGVRRVFLGTVFDWGVCLPLGWLCNFIEALESGKWGLDE